MARRHAESEEPLTVVEVKPLPIKVRVQALVATKDSEGEDVPINGAFEVTEDEARTMAEDGKVRIVGPIPILPDVPSTETAATVAKATAAVLAKSDRLADATRYGNKEGQSPPNNYGVPNANAGDEAFTSTDDLAKEGSTQVEETKTRGKK